MKRICDENHFEKNWMNLWNQVSISRSFENNDFSKTFFQENFFIKTICEEAFEIPAGRNLRQKFALKIHHQRQSSSSHLYEDEWGFIVNILLCLTRAFRHRRLLKSTFMRPDLVEYKSWIFFIESAPCEPFPGQFAIRIASDTATMGVGAERPTAIFAVLSRSVTDHRVLIFLPLQPAPRLSDNFQLLAGENPLA